MITSAQNTQVKNVIKLNQKAKARREQGLFIAEGRKMFLEAPDDWIEKVYVAESMLDDEEIMQKAGRFSWDAVENSVFRQMSDTQTPQGVLTVLRQPSYQLEDLLKQEAPLLMVLGGSAGSGKCRNNHPYRGRRRHRRCFSYKNLCGHHQSESYSCNNGIYLQNSFFLRRRCGIIKTETSGKRNPLFCRTFTG